MPVYETEEEVLLLPGQYKARVDKIEEVKGRYGPQLRLSFTVDGGNGVYVTRVGYAALDEKTRRIRSTIKLGRWFQNIAGRLIDWGQEQFDTDDLLRKCCWVTLDVHVTEDGNQVNRIMDVQPQVPMQPQAPPRVANGGTSAPAPEPAFDPAAGFPDAPTGGGGDGDSGEDFGPDPFADA